MKKTVLKIRNLKKTYSQRAVVDELSLHVNEKEVVGLLGPNGAGKSTAFHMIIGLIQSDSGDIFFHEEKISKHPIHKRALMGMGYLAQEPSVFRQLTVEQNILAILEILDLSKKEKKNRLEELLFELHLDHLRKKIALSLSGGERRRLEITRALVRKPKLLLLDEPFANIDPITVNEVKKLITILKKKNISVLITDHNAREIFSIVDRSYLMQDGKILTSGTVKELMQSTLAKRHYLGEDFQI